MNAKGILIAARAKLVPGFCVHANARNRFGDPCLPVASEAVRWDAVGACLSVAEFGRMDPELKKALELLADAIQPEHHARYQEEFETLIANWTDAIPRSTGDVLHAFDAAIVASELSQVAA
jgi:hypothetical protein